jgi:hypothetical protein
MQETIIAPMTSKRKGLSSGCTTKRDMLIAAVRPHREGR